MEQLVTYISKKINAPILQWSPLSGGDISTIYLLKTAHQRLILKINTHPNALAMFQAERVGIEAIASTDTIKTPPILFCEKYQETAFLLMEYIEAKRPSEKDFQRLGHALGKLHQVTNDTFGWHANNFIGSLNQSNQYHHTWLDFYIKERLYPQFQLAIQNSLLTKEEIPTEGFLIERGIDLFENIQPALLHGDLWSGNYLIAKDGIPYLIDTAIYYGHSEVDIAMTRLFGGFGQLFYDAYQEIHPRQKGADRRENWYQLYYLLVHLNLFGKGYYGAVIDLLKKL